MPTIRLQATNCCGRGIRNSSSCVTGSCSEMTNTIRRYLWVKGRARWQEYADQLDLRPVRYLLIAEAPPWSSQGTPQYLLDPESRVRTLMGALRTAFPGAHAGSSRDSLKTLAAKGFLLLDSSPFAMNYSSKRSSKKYDGLIGLTTTTYLQAKINSSDLTWSPDIRIAFSVKRNALSILKAIAQLSIGDRKRALSNKMIAVNGAGYPDAKRLREIYGLHTGSTT